MNRRDVLKLSAGIFAAYTPSFVPALDAASNENPDLAPLSEIQSVERWGYVEVALHGPSQGNPFTETDLSAQFSIKNRTVNTSGFYDGDGMYRIRFMPDEVGVWTYTTSSNDKSLTGHSGKFACVPPSESNHGPVVVRDTCHFSYADGSSYFPFGTTCYAWVHQEEATQLETLRTLKSAPFNKLRMCIFPKSYAYNHNEPPYYPFPRSSNGVNDYAQFNVDFFQHMERRILDLQALGIQADLILFHPYDRWGYDSMPAEVDDRYLKYVIARFAAFRNVWWSMANEYDLLKAKKPADWDRFARILVANDPSNHLRSIHYSKVMYDFTRPWTTHATLQSSNFSNGIEWREIWKKPVIYDECMYEGDIPQRWGNLSGFEMARRFWMGIIAGCYAGHGETYLSPDNKIWWSHGGTLHGTSPERIRFLRNLVEQSTKIGFTGEDPYYLEAECPEGVILAYLDFHQPIQYEFKLPANHSYRAEWIDPWEMTISRVPGTFENTAMLKLPKKPYQAVRFLRV
ncbi:MAG: DUF5060 domain-containing protein [Acidobacteriaceae bacterium]